MKHLKKKTLLQSQIHKETDTLGQIFMLATPHQLSLFTFRYKEQSTSAT
jgi:hypothetical protein